MTSDLEKSFKAKLRAIVKEKNRDPADLWQNLTFERFLVRLAHSLLIRNLRIYIMKVSGLCELFRIVR